MLFAGTLFDPSTATYLSISARNLQCYVNLCPNACSIRKLILRHVSGAQTIERPEHKIILFGFMHPNPVLDIMQRIRTRGANRRKNLFTSANSKNATQDWLCLEHILKKRRTNIWERLPFQDVMQKKT